MGDVVAGDLPVIGIDTFTDGVSLEVEGIVPADPNRL
jgi:hypothetical protein